ncbi:MAG: E3 binding domain-containing protein, partial [Chloroflexi bacterium]|nr:E3 binding domain-containing protein [Chloroflexota bacterium]
MSVTIELPHVGESVVEGTIGKWLKQPGDTVKRYEPLVEIITDKVTMEVPSPVDGSVVALLAQEGETLPMGAPIALVATADSPEGAEPQTASIEIETAEPGSPGTTGHLLKNVTPVGPTGGAAIEIAEPAGTSAGTPAPPAEATPTPATAAPTAASGQTRLSPAVRRLAQEHSIDVSQVHGTGLGGRVTRDDILKFLETGPAQAPAAAQAVAPQIVGETSADG